MRDIKESVASVAYQLGRFCGTNDRNRWIETTHMKIYFRKGDKLIDGRKRWVLEIGSVEVYEEFRSKHLFTTLMTFIESLGFSIYVENMLNPRLVGFFRNRGYKIIEGDSEFSVPCAYLEDIRKVKR